MFKQVWRSKLEAHLVCSWFLDNRPIRDSGMFVVQKDSLMFATSFLRNTDVAADGRIIGEKLTSYLSRPCDAGQVVNHQGNWAWIMTGNHSISRQAKY
ncbi:hypothetical protein ElyMa_000634100 [Elysia marginata]|uniref:Uncharacterized protein n=1 Tax=Elysia marginata TaxID=1093978 RepID=A0AAV4GCF4_9GAST|nr:hypothetical protein ElyMa_000634100 [Elysia marginata]